MFRAAELTLKISNHLDDRQMAITWLEKAAARGHSEAINKLATLVSSDRLRSLTATRQAAEAGSVKAPEKLKITPSTFFDRLKSTFK